MKQRKGVKGKSGDQKETKLLRKDKPISRNKHKCLQQKEDENGATQSRSNNLALAYSPVFPVNSRVFGMKQAHTSSIDTAAKNFNFIGYLRSKMRRNRAFAHQAT